MIHRKPTVIQIKAEDDMQDIQPQTKQGSQMTPSQPIRKRIHDINRQMQVDRSSPGDSPYGSQIFNALISIRDEVSEQP